MLQKIVLGLILTITIIALLLDILFLLTWWARDRIETEGWEYGKPRKKDKKK